MVITGTTAGNPTIVTTATNHTMATGNKVYIYDFRMDNVQRITFSAVPTSGVWSINYGTEQTVSLAFNATSLAIETALNNLASLSDVTVDGDYTNGFVVLFGSATLNTTPLVIASASTTPTGTYTLLATATPVVTTVTDITSSFNNEVNNVNSSLGHTITNITATQFSIPVNTSYSGREGYCILAKLQASFSFRIRTYGTNTH